MDRGKPVLGAPCWRCNGRARCVMPGWFVCEVCAIVWWVDPVRFTDA